MSAFVLIVVIILGLGGGIVSLVAGIFSITKKNKTYAIVAIIVGIISLGGLGIAGIVCGAIGLSKLSNKKKSK